MPKLLAKGSGAMTEQEATWEGSILKVLREASGPMHYRAITAKILDDELLTTTAATPSSIVAALISRWRSDGTHNIVRTEPGVYYLQRLGDGPALGDAEDTSDEVDVADMQQKLGVAAYGLHWERNKVDWSLTRGKLLGCDYSISNPDRSQSIDFSSQQGVYLLHSWDAAVVYVGMTATDDGGLFKRLRKHHQGQAWSAKWERFSWFGLLRVDDDEEGLADGPSEVLMSNKAVAELMEAVLIETLRPAFNDKSGNYMGVLYRQAMPQKSQRDD